MVASRQVLPSWHVLISGRTHEIPDKLKLMGIALAGKDRLAIQHFSKDTATKTLIKLKLEEQKEEKKYKGACIVLPNSPHVDSGGVLP